MAKPATTKVRYHVVSKGDVQGPAPTTHQYTVHSTCARCGLVFSTHLEETRVADYLARHGPRIRRWLFRWRKRLHIAGRRKTTIWYDDLDAASELALAEVEAELCPGPRIHWG